MLSELKSKIRTWNRARRSRHRARKAETCSDRRARLAVMCIVKNESMNIDEWFEHYFWQGADHIFVIDNGSTDDTVEKVQVWARAHPVTLVRRDEPHRQREHYRHVFRTENLAQRFRWLLIADADEFWFPTRAGKLTDVLDELDQFDVIYCNWTTFGSAGHDAHPASLRAALTRRSAEPEPHEFSKWVAKTNALGGGRHIGIHRVVGACSSKTITESAALQLNHYVIQSREFWREVKMQRGDVFDRTHAQLRDLKKFDEIDALCTVEDRRLADLVKRDAR